MAGAIGGSLEPVRSRRRLIAVLAAGAATTAGAATVIALTDQGPKRLELTRSSFEYPRTWAPVREPRGEGADHCRDFRYAMRTGYQDRYYDRPFDRVLARVSLVHEASPGGC